MTRFFAGVLSVIAVGVLFIAYGLLNPRAVSVSAVGEPAADVAATERVAVREEAFSPRQVYGQAYAPQASAPAAYPPAGYAPSYAPAGYPAYPPQAYPQYSAYPAPAPAPQQVIVPAAQPVQTVVRSEPPRTVVVERPRGRNWKKTALVIGGSTATGAGVGAVLGGKKGALIGAAIGGGASTIYESTK